MRELIEETPFGTKRLLVFPFATDDMTDQQVGSLGGVEALHTYGKSWGVRINVSFDSSGGSTREETDALKAAIDRCWEWVAEQEKSTASESGRIMTIGNMAYPVGPRGL